MTSYIKVVIFFSAAILNTIGAANTTGAWNIIHWIGAVTSLLVVCVHLHIILNPRGRRPSTPKPNVTPPSQVSPHNSEIAQVFREID